MAKWKNDSSQIKDAMGWGQGQRLGSEVPVDKLVDIDDGTNQAKMSSCRSTHGEMERRKEQERRNMEVETADRTNQAKSSTCTSSHGEMERKEQEWRNMEKMEVETGDRTNQAKSSTCTSSHGEMERKKEQERRNMERMENTLSQLKCHGQFQELCISPTHAILIDLNALRFEGRLVPQPGQDRWNNSFVKMPYAPESLIIKSAMFGGKGSQTGRWQVIHKQLGSLAKKTTASVDDVKKAIEKYNPKYDGQWTFDALQSYVKSSPAAGSLLPKIALLASKLPDVVKKAIPLLKSGRSASITLSQAQIACLLANAFYCTFPHRNSSNPRAEYHKYPTINFNSLFGKGSQRKMEKLKAIFNYFDVVTDNTSAPEGLVTFERRCSENKPVAAWRSSTKVMPKLYVTSEGTIEKEGTGMLQVDFACSMIGGGVLGSGLVQEEILFLMNPELIVSRLFTEKLDNNECLIISGSQQFSTYRGYSDTFEWTGSYTDKTKRDNAKRRYRQILAIDAEHYRHRSAQYNMLSITRELNKAYCGFKPNEWVSLEDTADIATGNWGCGAFNGDLRLKALIQLMAAAEAGRGLAFFTFNNTTLEKELRDMHHQLATQGTTVGKLYRALEDHCANMRADRSMPNVFETVWSML